MVKRPLALAVMVALTIVGVRGAAAQNAAAACPFSGQTPRLAVELFFGRAMGSHGLVSDAMWRDFLTGTVTPHFPDGLTVQDAYGQWLDQTTHTVVHEAAKVVLIVAPDTPTTISGVEMVMRAYRARFHQDSVGVVSTTKCAGF